MRAYWTLSRAATRPTPWSSDPASSSASLFVFSYSPGGDGVRFSSYLPLPRGISSPPLTEYSLSVAVVLLYALLAMTMRGCLPSSSVLPPRPSGVDGAFV